MNILFDLSGTVFGCMDRSLRPGIVETIKALRERGFEVDFWTNGPIELYEELINATGLEGHVYSKLKELPFKPDICVDDDPEDWMPGRVVKVSTYVSGHLPVPELSHEIVACV